MGGEKIEREEQMERETKTRDKIVKLSFYKYQNINLSYYNLFLL